MRVLALCSYPDDAAATRFRVRQMVEPLRQLGVEVELRPLLASDAFRDLYDRRRARHTAWNLGRAHLRRLRDVLDARSADVVLLQREAALLGPPVIEMLLTSVGRRPLVLDLDDPTWIAYDSPTFGRLGKVLKWPGKADWLIDRAAVVTCGSEGIARYVEARGATARVVPTVVDTEVFRPRPGPRGAGPPLVGWIGTHSTAPYLAGVAPALADAAALAGFRLLVVGAGDVRIDVAGATVERRPWSLDREASDFSSLDVGLYPLPDDEWARGKSGFKAIQYLACGVPYVVSPIGATRAIGIPGATHLEAADAAGWCRAVHSLVSDEALRSRMGAAGRAYAVEHHGVPRVAGLLAGALRSAL